MLTCPHCEKKFQDDWQMPSEYKGLRFNNGVLKHSGGEFVLPVQQRNILELLIRAGGKTVHFHTFWNYLYAHRPTCDHPNEMQIKVRIKRLREKISGSGLEIRNVRSVGYYLTETEKAA